MDDNAPSQAEVAFSDRSSLCRELRSVASASRTSPSGQIGEVVLAAVGGGQKHGTSKILQPAAYAIARKV